MSETVNDATLSFVVTDNTPATRFLASLSDGRTVIQDVGQGRKHTWARLTEWIKQNPHVSITGIRLQGPNGIDIAVPSNQKGYFFGQKQHAVWGGPQHTYFGVGYYDGQIVSIVWHRQPKFDNSFTEERTAAKAGFFLIENS